MSLSRIALRIAAVEALRGRTLVATNVLDSQIAAIDISETGTVSTDEEKPFISVYTDNSTTEGSSSTELRNLRQNGLIEFILESGINAKMTETDPETGVAVVVVAVTDENGDLILYKPPATDENFELSLDVLDSQITRALTDPNNVWAEIWRGLSSSVLKIERMRAANATGGIRLAARQLRLTLAALPDPVYGEPLKTGSVWEKFMSQLAADRPDLHETLQHLIGVDEQPLNHETMRRRLGFTLEEGRALLDMAPDPAEVKEPDIATITVRTDVE